MKRNAQMDTVKMLTIENVVDIIEFNIRDIKPVVKDLGEALSFYVKRAQEAEDLLKKVFVLKGDYCDGCHSIIKDKCTEPGCKDGLLFEQIREFLGTEPCEVDRGPCDNVRKNDDGTCPGYQRSAQDDEPCDECKNCFQNEFYEGTEP